MRYFVRRACLPVLALVMGTLAFASPAAAWWARGGYGWHGGYGHYYGPGIVIAPPAVVFGPPVVYGPPPVYYAQPPVAAGGGCYAGAYVCPLDQPMPAGAQCSCPVNGNTRVFGTAR